MAWCNVVPFSAVEVKPWYVYAHINPVTKAPFYIGKGRTERMHDKQSRNKAWKYYHRCLKELGLTHECHILSVHDTEEAALTGERSEILKALSGGHMLVNKAKTAAQHSKPSERLDVTGIRQFLKEERCRQGFTQKDLAVLCSLRQSTLSKIELGLINPTLPTLAKILAGLDLDFGLLPKRKAS